jgi:hypothetical protein
MVGGVSPHLWARQQGGDHIRSAVGSRTASQTAYLTDRPKTVGFDLKLTFHSTLVVGPCELCTIPCEMCTIHCKLIISSRSHNHNHIENGNEMK